MSSATAAAAGSASSLSPFAPPRRSSVKPARTPSAVHTALAHRTARDSSRDAAAPLSTAPSAPAAAIRATRDGRSVGSVVVPASGGQQRRQRSDGALGFLDVPSPVPFGEARAPQRPRPRDSFHQTQPRSPAAHARESQHDPRVPQRHGRGSDGRERGEHVSRDHPRAVGAGARLVPRDSSSSLMTGVFLDRSSGPRSSVRGGLVVKLDGAIPAIV